MAMLPWGQPLPFNLCGDDHLPDFRVGGELSYLSLCSLGSSLFFEIIST